MCCQRKTGKHNARSSLTFLITRAMIGLFNRAGFRPIALVCREHNMPGGERKEGVVS